MLDCHTKNKWWGPAEELAKHIRPLFKHLIEQAIASEITVAIVTFSEQTRYIRDALTHSIPNGGSNIIVRGGDGSWDSRYVLFGLCIIFCCSFFFNVFCCFHILAVIFLIRILIVI